MRRTAISIEAFQARARAEHLPRLSSRFRPKGAAQAWTADLTVARFLALPTYPLWYVGPDGAGSAFWNKKGYRRIRYRDALMRSEFRDDFARGGHTPPRRGRAIGVLALHCSTCGHYAIIDGHHRLTRRALRVPGSRAGNIRLTCLSGPAWRRTSILGKICRCLERREPRAPRRRRVLSEPSA